MLKYEPLKQFSCEEIDRAIKNNIIDEMRIIPLSVGEYCDDYEYALDVCFELLNNNNPEIRANAILGLAYIARNHGKLPKKKVIPILRHEYQNNIHHRGRITDAIGDISVFLKWHIEV